MTWIPQKTVDGSFTFFSKEFGEAFHSHQGAKSEAFEKFADVTQLADRALGDRIRLLDVCYGLGYNSAAAIETIWRVNPDCKIELYALEIDASVPIGAITRELLTSWPPEIQTILSELAQTQICDRPNLTAELLIGDGRQTVQTLSALGFHADAIFFDPFSPRKCPQLWTVEFFKLVSACLDTNGRLATYSRSAAVRSAMMAVGLAIGSITASDSRSSQWSNGTVAAWSGDGLPPLSEMEQDHLETRAGIAYQDPGLVGTAQDILTRQNQEQERSQRRSTSSWRRKWGLESTQRSPIYQS